MATHRGLGGSLATSLCFPDELVPTTSNRCLRSSLPSCSLSQCGSGSGVSTYLPGLRRTSESTNARAGLKRRCTRCRSSIRGDPSPADGLRSDVEEPQARGAREKGSDLETSSPSENGASTAEVHRRTQSSGAETMGAQNGSASSSSRTTPVETRNRDAAGDFPSSQEQATTEVGRNSCQAEAHPQVKSEDGHLDLYSSDEMPRGIGEPHVTPVNPSQLRHSAIEGNISTSEATNPESPPSTETAGDRTNPKTKRRKGLIWKIAAGVKSVLPGGSWWQIGLKQEGPQGERMVRSLEQLWGFAKKDRGLLALATFFLAAAALSEVAIPHYLAATIFSASSVAREKFNHNAKMLIIMTISCGIFSGLRAACFGILNLNMVRRMRTTLFETLISQDMEFFDRESVGELTSRLGSDCQSVSQVISVDLNIILRNALQGLGAFVFLVRLSWKMTAVTMALCALMWYCLMVYGRFQREIARVLQDTVAAANEVAEEAFSLARVIRTFGTEQQEIKRYKGPLGRLVEIGKRRTAAYSMWASGGLTIYNAAQVAAVVCGGSAVMAQAITSEQLTRFMLYAEWVVHATWWVGDHWASLMESVGSCDRVFHLLDMPKAKQLTSTGGLKLDNVQGKIEFRNVSFSYPTRPTVKVLDNVSLVINPGERVALVGLSGSGKSTLVGLLLRLYEPSEGQVLLDGVPLPDLDVHWYRKQLGVVSQEPRLFSMDIAGNIAYSSSESVHSERIQAAAKQAYAHQFVESLPEGYSTVVDNARLSGGQKQRIAIARALVRDPRILILDEATSALDAESEYNVQRALDEAINSREGEGGAQGNGSATTHREQKRTVLVIAHRLSTVRNSDRIIVMSSGRIIETGTHDDLIQLGGEYAKLNARQLDTIS